MLHGLLIQPCESNHATEGFDSHSPAQYINPTFSPHPTSIIHFCLFYVDGAGPPLSLWVAPQSYRCHLDEVKLSHSVFLALGNGFLFQHLIYSTSNKSTALFRVSIKAHVSVICCANLTTLLRHLTSPPRLGFWSWEPHQARLTSEEADQRTLPPGDVD